jgi:hypothetical protein
MPIAPAIGVDEQNPVDVQVSDEQAEPMESDAQVSDAANGGLD